MDPHSLSFDSQGILDELVLYHRGRLFEFEKRRERHARAKNQDGNYSLVRLLNGLREDRVGHVAPFEQACSDRIAETVGKLPEPGYRYVPIERRDLTVGTAGAGGFLVSQETAPGDLFVGYLNANMVMTRLGISRVSLIGSGGIPKISTQISTYWLSTEGTVITESQFGFAIAAGTPKNVGGYAEVSDLLLKQTSPAAQNFVLAELARATAAEIDGKGLQGSGATGQPTGILNTAGIGSVSGTSLAYAGVLDLIKAIEDKSGIVDPTRAGFVVAPDTARLLRAREMASGSGMVMTANDLAGFPAFPTKSMPNASLMFGDWSQVVLLDWGALQIGTDPYGVNSALFKTGQVGIRSLWSCDVVVLHPESFAAAITIT